jgi:hypothetical protein
MKDFKYKSTFASSVTKISGEELDKYISLAGLENLKPLMPKDVDLANNPDFIGIVLNAAVAGRANANDDGITIETGVRIAKNFILKFCNSNHVRNRVIGVIVNAGFSKFGDSKILTEEEASKSTDPINISLAVLLWQPVLNEEFINLVENSADPTSADYGALSASWEIFFNNYDIYVGNRNIAESKKVEDSEKGEYDKMLRCNGGAGKTKDGKVIYRVIKAENSDEYLIPAGIGLVETPAAEVKGLEIVMAKQLTAKANLLGMIKANSIFIDFIEKNQLSSEDATNLVEKCEIGDNETVVELVKKMQEMVNFDKSQSQLSLSSKNSVTKDESKCMKITKLADITDESLKTCVATEVTSFIEDELKKANEQFLVSQKEQEAAKKSLADTQTELETVKAELSKMQKEIAEQKASELMNSRMAFLDETYELTADDRKIIVAKVQKIASEEEWTSYVAEAAVLMKEKAKAYRQEIENKAKEEAEKAKAALAAVASTTPPEPVKEPAKEPAATQAVVDDALKNGQNTTATVPNASAGVEDFLTKFKNAFKVEENIRVTKY